MKIHEYQAKQFLSTYGVPVEQHILCSSAEDALNAYRKLGMDKVMVKAQVLTKGRGKAGGVKLAGNIEEVRNYTENILGMTINDFIVEKVLISEAINIDAEYYLSYAIDRDTNAVILTLSTEGGANIKDTEKNAPEKIHRFSIDPLSGIPDYLARQYASILFYDTNHIDIMTDILQKLYKLFVDNRASQIEINPLALTKDGNIIAIDTKMSFRENAVDQQSEFHSVPMPTNEDKIEKDAKEKGFIYMHMDGEIGCIVNSTSLAEATMDMIKLYGGKPANFLDIENNCSPNKIIEAIKLLLQHSRLRVLFVNIFGGTARCDDVAAGLLKAFEELKLHIPTIVRLTGINEEKGRSMLSKTRFMLANTMGDATQMAVSAAK